MPLFNEVFYNDTLFTTLFFSVKTVLNYPTLSVLKSDNPALYKQWISIANKRYHTNDNDADELYLEKAVYHAEFIKVVAISYASVELVDGEIKRYINKIVNDDEYIVLATFFDLLNQLSYDSAKSTPMSFPPICGHNIMNFDIPVLIKRFIANRNKFNDKKLPYVLRNTLDSKPWESVVIDTAVVWKFNGNDYSSIGLISDFMGLKKTVDIDDLPELSKKYWDGMFNNHDETLKYIGLQAANQCNLTIQLLNEFRQMK